MAGRPTLSQALESATDRIDVIKRDVSVGARSQRDHDRIVAEVEEVANSLWASVRGGTPIPGSRPSAPPLWIDGGRALY